MLQKTKNNKGQASSAEYAIVFFLVVSFVSAMTVYVRRVVQSRMHGARQYIANQIVATGTLQGTNLASFSISYEPYYTQSEFFRSRLTAQVRDHGQGLSGASDFLLQQAQDIGITGQSNQLSPRVLEAAP